MKTWRLIAPAKHKVEAGMELRPSQTLVFPERKAVSTCSSAAVT